MNGEKVLITGPAGQIAFPMVEQLAADNEVWGIARFENPEGRAKVDALGVTTVPLDLADGDLSVLPDDFTVVLHLAAYQGNGLDYDYALAVNAEGTGRLLHHCRKARAALVMSTASVYKPVDDCFHPFLETDPLGDTNSSRAPSYAISKIAQEAVARTCARLYDLPVVIARMNASYGANGGLPTYHLDAIMAGQPVVVRHDPCPYSPIHQEDINDQVDALLAAASVPATVVNWGGDEEVGPHEWCEWFGQLTGREPEVVVKEEPGTLIGSILDNTKRLAITEGMRSVVAARYPDALVLPD
jgi:nucleoside-diphosphate-sugar epimerase